MNDKNLKKRAVPTKKARIKVRLPAKKIKVVQAASDSCLFCEDPSVVDTWIQCMDCYRWAHDQCAGVDRADQKYTCDICRE